MSEDDLKFSRHNYTLHLRNALNDISPDAVASAESFFAVAFCYRILALCSLLQDGDVGAFAALLCKSAQARLYFLKQIVGKQGVPVKFVCSSKNIAFTAALGAGDLATASSIATLSPKTHFEGVEYEDDFLFFHFLHRIVCDPDSLAELRDVLRRWEEVLEGASSGYLDVCRALISEKGESFGTAFGNLIEMREQQLNAYKKSLTFDAELYSTEGNVFIEGLAVLRIAEMKGFSIRSEYKLIPRLARIPLGAALPPPDSWRSL